MLDKKLFCVCKLVIPSDKNISNGKGTSGKDDERFTMLCEVPLGDYEYL